MAPDDPPQPDVPPWMAVDGRLRREHEYSEHLHAVARRLVDERGIARRLAHKLVESRQQEREWHVGPGAQLWAAGSHSREDRPPPPDPLTVEEAAHLVMDAALREVWADAVAMTNRDQAPRQRPQLDQLWRFLEVAEDHPPDPNLAEGDRALARRGYDFGRLLLGWAHLIESGQGGRQWTTGAGRPLLPLRAALSRLLRAIEDVGAYKEATHVETYERVFAAKEALQALFNQARRAFKAWKEAAGKAWAVEEQTARRAVKDAVIEDAYVLLGIDRERIRAVLKKFDRMLDRQHSPAQLAVTAASILFGVEDHVAIEYAKEQLAKRDGKCEAPTAKAKPVAGSTSTKGATVRPLSNVDRLCVEKQQLFTDAKMKKHAEAATKRKRR